MELVRTEEEFGKGRSDGIPSMGQPKADAERRKKIGALVLVVLICGFAVLKPDSVALIRAREGCPPAPRDTPGCALVPTNPAAGQVTGIAAYSYLRGARNGPLNWGTLDCGTRFGSCAYCNNTCNGRMQSPVNVDTRSALVKPRAEAPLISLARARVEYVMTPGNFELRCDGRNPGTCGNVTYEGRTYNATQLHMHHLSEHDMDGFKFPLEMHLVHSHGTHLVVLGVFFDVGYNCNPDVQAFLDIARERCHGELNLPALIGKSLQVDDLISIKGSATTPPCTEGVIFVLSSRTQTVCSRQLREFARLEGNQLEARPLQPLNGRKPSVYK